MKCPHCKDQTLVISERKGIEIDYCPDCRGVWLDRGELDKILERSQEAERAAQSAAPQPVAPPPQAVHQPMPPPQPMHPGYQQPHYNQGHHNGHYQKPYYKKKKSFFEELFD